MISSQSHGSVYDRVIGKGIRHDQMHQRITCISAPGFETENKISNSGGKEDVRTAFIQIRRKILCKDWWSILWDLQGSGNGNVCRVSKFSLQEQFIIKSIYFDDMKQKDMAEILGATKGALNQRLNTILRKMRNMYMEAYSCSKHGNDKRKTDKQWLLWFSQNHQNGYIRCTMR